MTGKVRAWIIVRKRGRRPSLGAKRADLGANDRKLEAHRLAQFRYRGGVP